MANGSIGDPDWLRSVWTGAIEISCGDARRLGSAWATMMRNPYLHGLRGALALSVLLFHIDNSGLPTFSGPISGCIHFFVSSMEHSVEIFFGISGIVIVLAFRKTPSAWRFMADRALRIFPVLWTTVLVISSLLVFDRRHVIPLSGATIVANLLGLAEFLPVPTIHPASWSISFELVFYAMFVLFACLAIAVPRMVAIAIVACVGASFILTHVRAACFLSGMVIATTMPVSSSPRALGRVWLPYAGLMLLLGLLAWRTCYEMLPTDISEGRALAGDPRALAYFFVGLGCASVGLARIYGGQGRFSRWLCLPVVQWLGSVSYSLYLWQAVVMGIIKGGMYRVHLPDALGPWSQLTFLALSFPATLLVSWLSYRWIEGRLTRWIRDFVSFHCRSWAASKSPM